MEQIRSFIAIELSDQLRRELAVLQSKLKTPERPWIKWVEPSGIHLTLKFLGSIAASKTDEVARAMSEAVQEITPFRLTAEGLGVFPNPRRVQVVWVGIGGQVAKLARLHKQLDSRLADLGFAAEERPFSAHLTLARLRREAQPPQRQELGRLVAETEFKATGDIKVNAINLMKSQLTPQGAIYSRLASAAL